MHKKFSACFHALSLINESCRLTIILCGAGPLVTEPATEVAGGSYCSAETFASILGATRLSTFERAFARLVECSVGTSRCCLLGRSEQIRFVLAAAVVSLMGPSCDSSLPTTPSGNVDTCATTSWVAWADLTPTQQEFQSARLLVGAEVPIQLDYNFPLPSFTGDYRRDLKCDDRITGLWWTISDAAVVSVRFDGHLRAILRATALGQTSVRAVLSVDGHVRDVPLHAYVGNGGYREINYVLVVAAE